MQKHTIPIFYALDERFLKYGIVSLYSLRENAVSGNTYKIYFLHTDVTDESRAKVKNLLERPGFEIYFENVGEYLESIAHKFPLRDYYSKTTYFRLFIADMHPEYDKAIYIDSDTIIQGDMSDLFDVDIKGFILGACHEQAMVQVNEYGAYVEKCLGLDRNLYFNAGLLLINCVEFRNRNVLDRFIQTLQVYDCVVTQDEDYLNLLCKDHVKFIDQRWNTEIFGTIPYPIEEAKVLHYIMFNKPWHYDTCPHADIFYRYARQTRVYPEILKELENYSDEQKQRDTDGYRNLLNLAVKETNKEDNYRKVIEKRYSADRIAILQKIKEYERAGRFDEDVENDPPAPVLMPDDINYLKLKVDAGCNFLTSQMFFDNNIFYNFLYRVKDKGINVPVLPGIMPITTAKQLSRSVALSGTSVPERFRAIVDKFGDNPEAMRQAGIVYAAEQIIDLIANGVNHIHVYSMNKPDVAKDILKALNGIIV